MNLFNHNSIRHRFTLGLTTVITVVVFLFSTALIIINSQSIEKQLHSQLKKITVFSKKSLSIALWQFDYDYTKVYIKSLLLYEDIIFASVAVDQEEIAKEIRSRVNGLVFSDFKNSEKYITAEETIFYNGLIVGTIKIAVSKERIHNLVISASSLSILALVIVNLTILVFNYLMSNQYLFKPLSQLEDAVNAISAGKFDARINISSQDEIGKLAQSFDQMMTNLKQMTASRDELDHEVKERIRIEQRIEGLNRLKENLLGSDPLEKKLQMISDAVIDILDADFSRIWLIQECDSECMQYSLDDSHGAGCKEGEKCLHLMSSSGRYVHLDGTHARIPLGSSKIGEIALNHEQHYLTNDVLNDPYIQNKDWARKLNLVSFAGYRLVSAEGETIGVLALFCQHVLSNKDDTLLQTIVATASEVIQVSKSQAMLQKSEIKYRRLFENAQIGLFRSRVQDGKIAECNFRMAQIFGYDSPEECIANYIANDHYLNQQERLEVVNQLQKYGEVSNFKTQIRIKNGSTIWIQFSGRLSGDKDYFVGVAADITEQKHAEDQLRASLKEKEVLFKEIHHRVKNNMQIIQSLLSLQCNEIEEIEHRKPLMDSNNRIKSMALIHEILYRSNDIAVLDIETYFKAIVQHLLTIYQKPGDDIALNIEVAQVDMGMDMSIACGLIINEIVSNALKYAFVSTSKGRLSVSLSLDVNNRILLTISDNGSGFPENLDLKACDSLGLKIVKILVKGQLNGTITIKNDEGALFEISFPLSTR